LQFDTQGNAGRAITLLWQGRDRRKQRDLWESTGNSKEKVLPNDSEKEQ